MSGVSRWGSDIGGYDTLGDDPQLTPELLKRWIEFGAVSGVMRTKASGIALPVVHAARRSSTRRSSSVWRRYAKLHTQLYPYLRAADAEYRATGMPLMRALALTEPGDAAARPTTSSASGPSLLAAPVVEQGADVARRAAAARALARTGWRYRSSTAPGSPRRAQGAARRADRRACAPASTSCRCSCARARCCRC